MTIAASYFGGAITLSITNKSILSKKQKKIFSQILFTRLKKNKIIYGSYPFGVDLVVDLRSWSVLLSRSQVRFPLVPISVSKSIQSFTLA